MCSGLVIPIVARTSSGVKQGRFIHDLFRVRTRFFKSLITLSYLSEIYSGVIEWRLSLTPRRGMLN